MALNRASAKCCKCKSLNGITIYKTQTDSHLSKLLLMSDPSHFQLLFYVFPDSAVHVMSNSLQAMRFISAIVLFNEAWAILKNHFDLSCASIY